MPDKDDNTPDTNGQIKALAETVSALVENQKAMAASSKQMTEGLQSSISELTSRIETIKSGGRPDGDDDGDDDGNSSFRQVSGDDLETMSRADLVSHIIEGVNAQLKPIFKGLNEKIEGLDTTVATSDLKGQLKDVSAGEPDWKEWEEATIKIFKQSKGTLSMQESLQLAKAKNPDKVKELADKRDEGGEDDPNKDGKPKGDNRNGKATFTGIKPPGGGQDDDVGTMSKDEAANKAFDDVMAGIDLGDAA